MHNFNGVKYCKIVEEKRNFLECVKVYVSYQQHKDRFFDLPASGVRLSPRTGKGKIKNQNLSSKTLKFSHRSIRLGEPHRIQHCKGTFNPTLSVKGQ